MNNSNKLNSTQVKSKILSLTKKINKWNDEYYNFDNPTVSDQEFDDAYSELLKLENFYPQHRLPDSPTLKVGFPTTSLFQKFEHNYPMLSLDKATTKEEIEKFWENVKKHSRYSNLEFSLEHKIDGLSIALHYNKGKLIRAVTRGDGKIGENVTKNIMQVGSIKKKIPYLGRIEIRGEIFIEKKWLPIINQKIKEKIEEKYQEDLKKYEIEKADYDQYLNDLNDWKIKDEEYKNELQLYNSKLEDWKSNNKFSTNDEFQNSLFAYENATETKPKKPTKPTKPNPVNEPKIVPKTMNFKQLLNARNAASGTLRQKNIDVVKTRNLNALMYEVVDPLNHKLKTQQEVLKFIRQQGLPVQKNVKTLNTFDEIISEISMFKEEKETLDYDCDGLVIKFNDITLWSFIGATSKFPKYAIAFKFPNKEVVTTILDIKSAVGRTGKITYVGDIDPVVISDTTISRATLNNWNYINGLNLNIGDKVKIIKSGEIIPKIIELVEKNSDKVYPKETKCPSCKSELGYQKDLVDQFCFNDDCEQKNINNLIYATSREAFNIKALGKKNIESFYKKGYIKDIYDVFELPKLKDKILEMDNFQAKKTDSIIKSIEEAKNVSLLRTIYALGIDEIGMSVSVELSKLINSLEELLTFNFDNLIMINNIGFTIINSLKKYFSNPRNIELINKLSKILTITSNEVDRISKLLINKKICISGTFKTARKDLVHMIRENSGIVANDVTNDTDFLLTENESGTKFDKAKKLETKIISEEEFYEMINKKFPNN